LVSHPNIPNSTGHAPARRQRYVLIAILALFVVLSIVYNHTTPLFEGPDEAAHFLYVEYLANGRGLPALEHSPRDVLWEGLQQPPLYYALGALLTGWIATDDLPDLLWRNPHRGGETGGINMYYHSAREAFPYRGTTLAVHLARLLNTFFGLATIIATFLAAGELFPHRPVFALGAAAIVAFNPQFLSTAGSVSNDGATAAFCSVGIWLLLRMFRRNDLPPKDAVLLGVMVGLAALTKPSGLALAFPAGVAIAVTAWRRRSWSILLWGWGAVGLGVLLLGGWWYARNVALYGDPLAWSAVVAIEAETIRAEPIPLSEALVYSTWMQKSFWGVFGSGVLMDFSVYRALEIVMRLSALGLLVWLVRQAIRRTADTATWLGLGLLGLWSGLVYLALLRFMQNIDATNQGRLLFPAISALSILFLLGLTGFFPRRLAFIPPVVVSVGLLVLAIVAPVRYIVPAYAHPPAGQQLAIDNPAEGMPVRFGDKIELLDYTISPTEIKPGSVIHLSFDWRGLAEMDTSYKLFAHILGYDGERLTQLDTIPYRGRFATLLWQPGHTFRDEYDLFITGKARPSLGQIQIGFFAWDDPGERLSAFTASGQPIGDHIELAPFKIAPKKIEPPEIPLPLDIGFGEAIRLGGYALSPSAARAGELLTLTLYWEAKAPVNEDYSIFIHVLDRNGEIVTQQDMPPQGGNYPTSIWGAGEFITDEHTLMLPPDLPAGDYTLALGLYQPQSGQRLPVNAAGQTVPDGRATVGTVKVVAP
jgi:hypothetical protein